MEHISGIYRVTNKENNKVYIGSSVSCYDRWKQHKSELRKGIHVNSYLQRSWDKYGEESFLFEVIEVCEKSKLKVREAYWIEYYGGINSDSNYNLMDARRNSPNELTRKKISNSRKGIKLSEETKRKISEYNKLHPNPNFTNRERSAEERKKVSDSLKGHIPWNKGLTKADHRVAKNIKNLILVGSNPSDETRKKISNTLKQQHLNGKYDYEQSTKKRIETYKKHKEEGFIRKTRKDKGIKKNPEIGKRISEGKLKANAQKRKLGLPLRNDKKED